MMIVRRREAVMHRAFRVLFMVLAGIIGGWGGYWIGHLAGWSVDAEWPWEIGGGTGAVLLSIGMAVAGVLLVDLLFWLATRRRG
jgi:hypothetical protein